MAMSEASKVRWDANKIILDPSRPRGPQIAAISAQISAILGGPIFGLVGMLHFPLLIPDRALAFGGLMSLILCFTGSILVLRSWYFPKNTPFSVQLKMHLGVAVCATGWMIGAIDIANGYATPVVTEDVPIVYKRASRQADPKRRSYYVGTRLWSSPRDIVEITVPHVLFDRLDVPDTDLDRSPPDFGLMPNRGHVRLLVGRGRFGIEWMRGIAHTQPDAVHGDWKSDGSEHDGR